MLKPIQEELQRLNAGRIVVALEDDFAPDVGTLVRVEFDEAVWRLIPGELLNLLKELPSRAGAAAVGKQIEKKGNFVWHGPSPSSGRDHGEPGPPEKKHNA